jgi:hypothetical protein
MSRYRDNKGRFIAPKISEKLEKKTTKRTPPYTNSSKIRAGKILGGESSKATIATTTKNTKSEATVQIEDIRQQEREEALATPSKGETGKETRGSNRRGCIYCWKATQNLGTTRDTKKPSGGTITQWRNFTTSLQVVWRHGRRRGKHS